MFKILRIKNLILIDQAEISFGPGLNILTGETGSGKSAILTAIRLISGERAESQMIRKEADFAIVEAVLEPFDLPSEEGFSPHVLGAGITVRREIHRSGKNRCFIEEQQVSLAFMRKCLESAIERIDQSSSLSLCTSEEQKNILDTYADISADVASFAQSYKGEKAQECRLDSLVQSQREKDRILKWAEEDLSAIEEVNWKEGEEGTLNEEHNLLSHTQELLEKIGSLTASLSDGPSPIVLNLKKCLSNLESCVRFDPKIGPIAEIVKGVGLELEETSRWLESYTTQLEADPNRLEMIERRIGEIEAIKRRFGSSFAEVEKKKKDLITQIDTLSKLETDIETLQKELIALREKNRLTATELSQRRRIALPKFSTQVEEQLQSLNLPHAQFCVSLICKPISFSGHDEIQFLFSANPGVPPSPLEQCASGGELSRLLLAVKIVLSEKILYMSSCLVFDEIDSNVGGQTASILGEKLKKLAEKRQVICVTHFVQVAKCALHHFLVSKIEKNGYAFTRVVQLSFPDRENEYNRMLGMSTENG
jgi:DNA repair protein RecN (Recombination protein N)